MRADDFPSRADLALLSDQQLRDLGNATSRLAAQAQRTAARYQRQGVRIERERKARRKARQA